MNSSCCVRAAQNCVIQNVCHVTLELAALAVFDRSCVCVCMPLCTLPLAPTQITATQLLVQRFIMNNVITTPLPPPPPLLCSQTHTKHLRHHRWVDSAVGVKSRYRYELSYELSSGLGRACQLPASTAACSRAITSLSSLQTALRRQVKGAGARCRRGTAKGCVRRRCHRRQ